MQRRTAQVVAQGAAWSTLMDHEELQEGSTCQVLYSLSSRYVSNSHQKLLEIFWILTFHEKYLNIDKKSEGMQ